MLLGSSGAGMRHRHVGLRTWRPDADSHPLSATFEDVQSLARQCRFRDCRHQDEPGCTVRANIDADRLLNYQKLLRDAQRAQETPLGRIARRQKWKVLGKAGTRGRGTSEARLDCARMPPWIPFRSKPSNRPLCRQCRRRPWRKSPALSCRSTLARWA